MRASTGGHRGKRYDSKSHGYNTSSSVHYMPPHCSKTERSPDHNTTKIGVAEITVCKETSQGWSTLLTGS